MDIYYIHVNTLCILLLVGVLSQMTRRNEYLPVRRRAFNVIVATAILLCASDMAASVLDGANFSGVRIILHVADILYYAATVFICYSWTRYVHICIDPNKTLRKRISFDTIPMLAMMAVIFTNPLTNYLFSIDAENCYARENGIYVYWVIAWSYLFISMAEVLIARKSAKTRLQKGKYTPLLLFNLYPALTAIAQMIFYGLSTLQTGITLSIILIVFSSYRDQIYRDDLTGLNNRRALSAFLDGKLQQSQTVSVLMCDLDLFKKINDRFGHSSGDAALKHAAAILRKACEKSNLPIFLCRYGGDEFVLCGVDVPQEEMEMLRDHIIALLEDFSQDQSLPYELHMSIGLAESDCSDEQQFEALVKQADREMYCVKKANSR